MRTYKETTEDLVLFFLFHVGELREQDLRLFTNSQYKNSESGNRLVTKLLEEECIYKKEYKFGNSVDKTFGITEKGKDKLQDKIHNKHLQNYREYLGRIFRTPPEQKLPEETPAIEKRLDDNSVLMMFFSFGVPVFTINKPSLLYLRDMIKGSPPQAKKNYRDHISKEECEEALEYGIYYSITEFMEFVKVTDQNFQDNIYGTRARGVFISKKNCFPVYTSKKSDNRLMLISKKGEDNLYILLKNLTSFTNIERSIPDFDEYTLDSQNKPLIKTRYSTSPSAVVFCDGDKLPYLIAKDNDYETTAADLYSKKGKGKATNPDADKKLLFTANTMSYKKIYVIPYSLSGQSTLKYLSLYSEEEIYEDEKEFYSSNPKEFVSDNTPSKQFRHHVLIKGLTHNAIYMPAFEAKEINQIAKKNNWVPVIITKRELMNSISRAIGREVIYYDIETAQRVDEDEITIYNKEGNVAGVDIIYNYLKEKGIGFNKSLDGYSLAKKFDIPYIEFYNRIARGDILPVQIESKIEVKPISKPKKKITSTKALKIYMDRELYSFIHEYAEKNDTSMSTVIDKLVRDLKEGKK